MELNLPVDRTTELGTREFRVSLFDVNSTGHYYHVSGGGGPMATVKRSCSARTYVCLRCRAADDCNHARAARKVHRQLFGTYQ